MEEGATVTIYRATCITYDFGISRHIKVACFVIIHIIIHDYALIVQGPNPHPHCGPGLQAMSIDPLEDEMGSNLFIMEDLKFTDL